MVLVIKKAKIGPYKRTPQKSTPGVVRKVAIMIKRVNPPTQREMATQQGVSQSTIHRIIKNTLQAKLRRKCKVHKLNAAQIEKRCQNSWKLSKRLNCDKWKNFVTTDEEMFWMAAMVVVESATSVLGIMILQNLNLLNVIRLHQVSWLGLELVSTAKPRFRIIPKGVKVNSQFYIDKVLKPFIKHDAPRMFPGDQIKDMVFHQDSASSHTSKTKHELCYTSGVDASKSRCSPSGFCYLGDP